MTTIIGDSVQDQLKRGDIVLINFWSVQKQLHIPGGDTWFTANLSNLQGTIQSQARILCNVLQLLNCSCWDQCLQFSRQIIIEVYRWEGNSNGRADVAVFPRCKCKFAVAAEPAYVLLLALFDVLITVFYDGVYKSKVFQFGCLV
jgi:hypothetical protein